MNQSIESNINNVKQINILPIIVLIVINLWPIIGIYFFDWNISAVLIMYWLENFVIGFYNFIKILMAKKVMPTPLVTFGESISQENTKIFEKMLEGRPVNIVSKIFSAFFFIFQYGLFTLAHGITIYAFVNTGILPFYAFSLSTFFLPIIFLFISHGVSFVNNFIGKKEYASITSNEQMVKPYSRVTILHISIIVIGFGLSYFHTPTIGIVFLIILKTILDVTLHIREHKKYTINSIAN